MFSPMAAAAVNASSRVNFQRTLKSSGKDFGETPVSRASPRNIGQESAVDLPASSCARLIGTFVNRQNRVKNMMRNTELHLPVTVSLLVPMLISLDSRLEPLLLTSYSCTLVSTTVGVGACGADAGLKRKTSPAPAAASRIPT